VPTATGPNADMSVWRPGQTRTWRFGDRPKRGRRPCQEPLLPPPLGEQAYYNYQNSQFYQIQSLESRIRSLEIEEQQNRNRLESRIRTLASESCQTGRASTTLCPGGFKGNSAQTILACANAIQSGNITGPVTRDVTVTFSPRFRGRPTVRAALAGFSIYIGTNVTISVSSVNRRRAILQFTIDNFVPVAATISWFACPPAVSNGGGGGGSSEGIDDFQAGDPLLSRQQGFRVGYGFPKYDPSNFLANAGAAPAKSPYFRRR